MYKYLFLCYSLFFCLTSLSQNSEYQALILNDNLTENANSCIRKASTSISIEAIDKITIEYIHVITVFNSYGDKDIDAYLHYDENVSVKNLQAKIFDKLGNEIKKFKKSDFRDVSAVDGGTLYDDSRVYYLEYIPIEYPYTVEFTYEIKNTSTAFIRPWFPIQNYYQSVELSEFNIVNNSDSNMRHMKANLNFSDNILIEESINSISCQARGISALKYEKYSPSIKTYTPHLRFALSEFKLEGINGKASNWKEMGLWQYNKLIKGRDEVKEETKEKILSIVAGIDDPLEKAKLVYKFVQDNTRYISVQVGIGGWQPILAEEVDKVKYGDCKGLTNYTKALLKIAGVNSNYTVVYAGSRKEDIDKDFASMQGDHVILQVPIENKNIWLECTSQDIPFGFLGSFTDDRNVLVVNENGGVIERTIAYKPKDNYQKITSSISVSKSGDISGNATVTSLGTQFNQKYSFEKQSQKEVIKRYKNYYGHLKNLDIESFKFRRDDEKIEFKEDFNFTSTSYSSKFGNRFMFVPNVLNQTISIPGKYKNRMTPFTIPRGYFDEDKIEFKIPDNYVVESCPKPINISSEFGNYSATFEVNAQGKLIYKRSMLLNDGEYAKEEYSDFREFLIAVNKADQSKVILNKKT